MIKKLAKVIPNFMKPALERVYYFPSDVVYMFKGRESMVPPKSLNFVGVGDYVKAGQEFKRYFIELADLKPNERVLDVGCGNGRMAVPLTDYLSPEGGYWGFDIVKKGIAWCQSHISAKYSNFHFQHSDVYSQHYNPHGKVQAQDFQFPYEDDFFDIVFLTSVFTHMLPSDMENYLGEISRVLKAEGKCLITFFIMNEESENLVHQGRSILDLSLKMDGFTTTNIKDPEAAIAYDEESIKRFFEKYGLKIIQPIHYGSWCERDNSLSYQDIIVATKEHSN